MKWRPVIIMAIVALAIWLAFDYGYDSGMANGLNQANQANQEMLNKLEADKKALSKKLAYIDKKYVNDMVTMQKRVDDAKKQANQYEPPKAPDCDCSNLDPEWVRIHDAAASVSGVRRSEPTSVDDDQAKPIGNDKAGATKKRAIEVITDNYAECSVYVKQLDGLQSWIDTLQKNGLDNEAD